MAEVSVFGPGSNRKYKITAKGITDNENFRWQVTRWIDGSVWRLPFGTEEGTILNIFARYPEKSLTAYEVWHGGDMVPMQVEESIEKLLKRELIQLESIGEETVYEQPSRTFPQTQGDWINLAADIKEKDPGSIFMVNAAMCDITEETGFAEEQKRWLMQKAGELGIK